MKPIRTKEIAILLAIILLAAYLRFNKLGEIPNGLYVDEATSGYNAYSILLTGKDEYGKAFPVAFRFLGSYTPGIYVYLTSLAIRYFGLNIFSVRLTSAIFGTLGILVIYFLLKSIKFTKTKHLPLIGAFIFAISPWAIFFSRTGYEINTGFIIFSLGILFLWLGFTRRRFLLLAFPVLSISTYGSHLNRYLVPFVILFSLAVFRKELFSKKSQKYSLLGLFIALLIQIPNFYLFATPAFNTKGGLFYKDLWLNQAGKISPFLPSFVAYPLSFVREFLSRYLTYFSPRSLFLLGDSDIQRSIPGLSVFYSWMLVPYLLGLYRLWQTRATLFSKYLILLLLIFPVPLALTSDPFSSQRGLHLLLPLIVIISLGTSFLIHELKNFGLLIFIILSLVSLIFLWRSYFVLLPYERAKVWGYGFEKLADEIFQRSEEKFIIDQARLKPAYIELAFFLKHPPNKLQEAVGESIKDNYYSNVVFEGNYKFANIETRTITWREDIYKKQILVGDELTISREQAKEHFLTKVFEIRDPLEQIVFAGYQTNPELKCKVSYVDLYCNRYK